MDETTPQGRAPQGDGPPAESDRTPPPGTAQTAAAEPAAEPPKRPGRLASLRGRTLLQDDRPASVLLVFLAAVTILGLIAILLGTLVLRDGTAENPRTVAGPLNGRENATFEVMDGVGAIRLRSDDLNDDLYRVNVPGNHPVRPSVTRNDGDVRLNLEPAGSEGLVDVALNAGVLWTLRLHGGTRQTVIDLRNGRLDGIELGGGSTQIDLTLPAPSRVVPVRLTAGAERVEVRLPVNTPVRVQFAAGAGQVNLDGAARQGIAPGQSFTGNGFGEGTNTGIDFVAQAGVGSLSVTQY
ncbi:hypothetical protein [Paractinoplanes rishiriensis]|uniref:Uncharacterized protein n=1 Tax=Paractinoplanes rishiriensis TaxID=1050105 RepID=A0A919N1E5_9ACTN|nr:hypothetical protein [Actinoplanes rishiriensis]GIE96712.1 hypothetical protein Ari01nite_41770 [Actinoplanes rishiriensis]